LVWQHAQPAHADCPVAQRLAERGIRRDEHAVAQRPAEHHFDNSANQLVRNGLLPSGTQTLYLGERFSLDWHNVKTRLRGSGHCPDDVFGFQVVGADMKIKGVVAFAISVRKNYARIWRRRRARGLASEL
jgi:hypothetical protein